MSILLPEAVNSFITEFAKFPQVEAIMLSGSKATGLSDKASDYDFYIYCTSEVDVNGRNDILSRHCSYYELNNQYWETEDNGTLKCGADFDLIYRDIKMMDSQLANLKNNVAYVGYTTCIWANIQVSKVVYDRNGLGAKIIADFDMEYSDELANAIIKKNMSLLSGTMPAYDKQIAKAIKRGDYVNAHNRVDQFLASYFDILFALNRMPNVGEKRIMKNLLERAKILPVDFEKNVKTLLESNPLDEKINTLVAEMVTNLKKII